MANHRLYAFWGSLTEALRTGEPQNEVKGGGPGMFETLYADPNRLRQFLSAMTGISHGANMTIARTFPWQNYKSFVDVGTAQGDLAAQVALANDHLRGQGSICGGRPDFQGFIAALGLSDRVSLLRAASSPTICRRRTSHDGPHLHDWDRRKKMLIKKAFDAVPVGGALIVYESIIDDDRSQNVFGLLMSLNMLIETQGGFDYTGADCAGWMREAGFSRTRVEPLVGPDSMVIGVK